MPCRSERCALAAALAALTATVSGCDVLTAPFSTNRASGDPYPITVDVSSGAIRLGTREPGSPARDSLLDVLSPFSVLDVGQAGQARASQRSWFLLDPPSVPDGPTVARAELIGTILEMHPCEQKTCETGAEGSTFAVQAVLGADLFAGDALRLDLQRSRLTLLPDIAGDDIARANLCEAVFSDPFRGGGTLLFGGTELPYTGRRIAISACAAFQASRCVEPAQRGTDLMLVVSTAVGVTLLGENAYQRYRRTHAAAPPLESLPAGSVTIPSGRIDGHLTTLSSLALVGKNTKRGACGDVCAHRCIAAGLTVRDCSCLGTLPGAPSVVELPTSIDVLVISDTEPLLVGVRTELRPDAAEVDGVLGTAALKLLQLDIDYPNNRLLARCSGTDPAKCAARPDLPNHDQYLPRIRECPDPAEPEECLAARVR
jgi:hypothetical protein